MASCVSKEHMTKPIVVLVFALFLIIELFRTAGTNYPFQQVNRATKGDLLRANATAPTGIAVYMAGAAK